MFLVRLFRGCFLWGFGLLFFGRVCCFLFVFFVLFVPFFLLFCAFFRFLCGVGGRPLRPFWALFFFFLFVVALSSSSSSRVGSLLRGFSSFGFCGSRSSVPPASVWSVVVAALPLGVPVSCGCVGGLCGLARSWFSWASVFRVSSFGRGRGAFAARSVALVRSVASQRRPLWVSFPARSCPSGLLPSSSSSRCFRGLGSGSWASAAFALGSGVPVLLWLPSGVVPPSGWGFLPFGAGWWFATPPQRLF